MCGERERRRVVEWVCVMCKYTRMKKQKSRNGKEDTCEKLRDGKNVQQKNHFCCEQTTDATFFLSFFLCVHFIFASFICQSSSIGLFFHSRFSSSSHSFHSVYFVRTFLFRYWKRATDNDSGWTSIEYMWKKKERKGEMEKKDRIDCIFRWLLSSSVVRRFRVKVPLLLLLRLSSTRRFRSWTWYVWMRDDRVAVWCGVAVWTNQQNGFDVSSLHTHTHTYVND